ncbi:O-linked N-acetylglucosamine transferase, SPINDLY family protein [Roseobacteraceae bacterium NS-SX3]
MTLAHRSNTAQPTPSKSAAASVSPADRDRLAAGLQAGECKPTASACAALLNSFPLSPFLWETLGLCHLNMQNLDQAATCLNKASHLDPRAAAAVAGLAEVARRQSRPEQAEALYRKALSIEPENLPALTGLGRMLAEAGRAPEAAELLGKAAALAPGDAQLAFDFAAVLRSQGALPRARALFAKAAELSPGFAAAHVAAGEMAAAAGDTKAALAAFKAALKADPADDHARALKLQMMEQLNDWRWIGEYREHRRHLGLRGRPCAPQALIGLEDNPDLLRVRTQAFASRAFPPLPAAPAQDAPHPARLRIGYFATGPGAAAALARMAPVIAAHAPARHEVFLYTAAPAEAGPARIRSTAGMDASATAALARQDGLHIAVDLEGYAGAAASPFAQRLAPLHIACPGHPGTLGSPSFDYLAGDATLCPPGSERFFDEHLIRLPHGVLAANAAAAAGSEASRRSCGLPDSGFVFCNFSARGSITPREFDIWMRLLNRAEGSVLWLEADGGAADNLRREAQARGADPDRLIFAPGLPDGGAGQMKAADLFLDTFTLNGGAAAAAALQAGLPVLTLPGRQYAARTSASLLTALELPGLIAADEKAYESRALELAQDADHLAGLRAALKRNRQHAAPFDAARLAQSLETGFAMAFHRWLKGLGPDHLTVPADPGHSRQPARDAAAA